MIEFEGLIVPNEGHLRIIKNNIKGVFSMKEGCFRCFPKTISIWGDYRILFKKVRNPPPFSEITPPNSNSNSQKKTHKPHTLSHNLFIPQ